MDANNATNAQNQVQHLITNLAMSYKEECTTTESPVIENIETQVNISSQADFHLAWHKCFVYKVECTTAEFRDMNRDISLAPIPGALDSVCDINFVIWDSRQNGTAAAADVNSATNQVRHLNTNVTVFYKADTDALDSVGNKEYRNASEYLITRRISSRVAQVFCKAE